MLTGIHSSSTLFWWDRALIQVTSRVSMRLQCGSVSFIEGSNGMHGTLNPCGITFSGGPQLDATPTLLDFWRWAFSDICDDDIKGILAEWMMGTLLGCRSRMDDGYRGQTVIGYCQTASRSAADTCRASKSQGSQGRLLSRQDNRSNMDL